jgi:beta-barrel assembly-enhancing protease
MRRALRSASIVLFAFALGSCGSMPGLGDMMQSAASGNISASSSTEGLQKTGDAFQAASKEITPEEEYYIGRTVAATVLTIYKPWDNPKANEYLNTLGEGLSLASVLPETFTGYHFLIMDTDDINAFGAPSGFVLVSRGLLRCATTED